MKRLIIVFLSIGILSCNGQNNKNKNMLDLEYLKKNATISDISYNGAVSSTDNPNGKNIKHYKLVETKENNKITIEGDSETGYKKTFENNDFIENTEYDSNGNAVRSDKKSIYGFDVTAVDYGKDGKIINEINYDALFKFNNQDVFNYLKRKNFNLDKAYFKTVPNSEIPKPMILRGSANDFKFLLPELSLKNELVWLIVNVEGNVENKKGIYFICLDGVTGKALLIKEYIGKKSGKNGIGTYPNYNIIFPK